MCTHTVGGFEPLILVNQVLNRSTTLVRRLDLAGRNESATGLQMEPVIVLQGTKLYWLEFDLPSCPLVSDARLPQTHYDRYDALVREAEGWAYWCLETPGAGLFPYRQFFIVWYGPANGCRTILPVCDHCCSFWCS
jgi:hypothetical protein